MTELFNVDRSVITRHVNNVFKDNELKRESNVQKMHIANSDKPVQFYSLEVIIQVRYRVKSKRGVEFRQWANKILKQYIFQGYAINEKRLAVLQKTVDIQTKMLACTLDVEEADVLRAVNLYKGGEKRISDGALVAITLMIAESNPEEKDIMVKLVMNLLTLQINVILGGW